MSYVHCTQRLLCVLLITLIVYRRIWLLYMRTIYMYATCMVSVHRDYYSVHLVIVQSVSYIDTMRELRMYVQWHDVHVIVYENNRVE